MDDNNIRQVIFGVLAGAFSWIVIYALMATLSKQ